MIALIFSASCSYYDDIDLYSRNKIINVPNLIHIETYNQYHLNDTLFVNVSFSRYLPEEGYPDLLDVHKTTLSDTFSYGCGLYKKTAYDNWAYYDVTGSLIVTKGVFYYDDLASLYNPNTKNYELRFGIPLKEIGEFKLILNNELFSNEYGYDAKGVPLTIVTSVDNPGVNIQYNNSEYTFQVN